MTGCRSAVVLSADLVDAGCRGLPAWSHGRVTLLGDAAHPMYPMGSNGAGQAILDATSLGEYLAQCPDPTDALLAYQEDRLATTSEVVLRNR